MLYSESFRDNNHLSLLLGNGLWDGLRIVSRGFCANGSCPSLFLGDISFPIGYDEGGKWQGYYKTDKAKQRAPY